MKKLLNLIAVIVLLLPHVAQAVTFSDVSVTHPMHESIMYLAERGYVSGYEDGTFKPDRVVTRAEILKFALKAAEIEIEPVGEVTFTDVPQDAWYYSLVLTASKKGIVSGYEDGTFQPDRVVTRAEGTKIILKALNVKIPESYSGGLKDVSNENWFAPYVEYIRKYHLLTIEGDEFKPENGLKRQDVAELVYHFIKAKEVLKTPLWSVQAWLVFAGIYLLFCLITWHFVRSKKFFYLYIIFAPLAILYLIIRSLTFTIIIDDDEESRLVISHRKQFAYFRSPRRLEKELMAWLDANAKPIVAFCSVVFLWIVMIFIILTQIHTLNYQKPFKELAQTYGTMDS
jgi:hypothetical protein